MPYRVERAKTGRAVCKDALCKKNAIKIEKGELRLGAWVEVDGHGSWAWKHWGCTTGSQVENIREYLKSDSSPDGYDWDMVDGFDEGEKMPLTEAEKDKFKRAVIQGHLDPEDFRGDPEKNKLGERGIHLTDKQREALHGNAGETATKKRRRSKGDAEDEEDAKPTKKKAKTVKNEDEMVKPASKKSKVKAESKHSDAEPEVKPVKKPKGKSVKKEENDEVTKPVSKKNKIKKETSDAEAEPESKPVKKTKGKSVKKEEKEEDDEAIKPASKKSNIKNEYSDAETELESKPLKKRMAKAIKKEDVEDEATAKPAAKGRGRKAVKQEVDEDAVATKGRGKKAVKTESDGDEAPVRSTTKGRGKKAVKGEPVEPEGLEEDEDAAEEKERPKANIRKPRSKKVNEAETQATTAPAKKSRVKKTSAKNI